MPDARTAEPAVDPAAPLADPVAVLRRVFGYESFRGPQAEIIEHVCQGGDALVLMPTGGGKSLCYQIPALVRHGVGIVVSPLIALMQDQVRLLRDHGVEATFINSSLPHSEIAVRLRATRALMGVFIEGAVIFLPSITLESASNI